MVDFLAWLEPRSVGAFRDLHDDRFVKSFGEKVLLKLFSEFRDSYAYDRVLVGVVPGTSPEHGNSNLLFFDGCVRPVQRTIAQVVEEFLKARRVLESRACHHALDECAVHTIRSGYPHNGCLGPLSHSRSIPPARIGETLFVTGSCDLRIAAQSEVFLGVSP